MPTSLEKLKYFQASNLCSYAYDEYVIYVVFNEVPPEFAYMILVTCQVK